MEHIFTQVEILWPALLAGILVLATHVPLGREVLQRGIIFLDLAIAQIAAFGVVIASTLSLGEDSYTSQTVIAVIAAIGGAMGLYHLRNLSVKVQEAIIGIVFILSATGSILLLATDPHGAERLKDILVGQILWIQGSDLLPLAAIYSTILVIWFSLQNKVGAWLFYPLFAITITLSTQVVGVYLVFASLIIPSLATLNQPYALAKSFALGVMGYSGGLLISALFDLPAGATIVWCLASIAIIYYSIHTLLKYRNQNSVI